VTDEFEELKQKLQASQDQVKELKAIADAMAAAVTTSQTAVDSLKQSLAAAAGAVGTTGPGAKNFSESNKIWLTSVLTLLAGLILAGFSLYINMANAKDVEFTKVGATLAFADAQKTKLQLKLALARLNEYLGNLGPNKEENKREALLFVDADRTLSDTLSAATLPEKVRDDVQATLQDYRNAKADLEKMNEGPQRSAAIKTGLEGLEQKTKATIEKIDEWLFPTAFKK
jgi:hypothetical protein